MNCISCSKEKNDFEVWNNKIVISATYDSAFQDHEIIRKMDAKSVICHDCISKIEKQVDESRR